VVALALYNQIPLKTNASAKMQRRFSLMVGATFMVPRRTASMAAPALNNQIPLKTNASAKSRGGFFYQRQNKTG
jgi:hypothetical protein